MNALDVAKQDVLNAGNKLPLISVGNGDITSNELSTLAGIITTETMQHQLDMMKTNMQSLTGLQDIAITDINNLETSVATI